MRSVVLTKGMTKNRTEPTHSNQIAKGWITSTWRRRRRKRKKTRNTDEKRESERGSELATKGEN